MQKAITVLICGGLGTGKSTLVAQAMYFFRERIGGTAILFNEQPGCRARAQTPERLISSKRSSLLTGCAVCAVGPVFYSFVCSGLIHGAGNRVRDWLARSTVGSSISCGRRPLSEVEICA